MKKVDEYIDLLPPEKAVLVEQIRELLFQLVPGIDERFSFKLPFYHYFGMFCYINSNKEGVYLAFCRGKDLLDEFPQLELNGRATIATVTIRDRKDIDRLQIRELISVAAIWNEEAKRQNIRIVAPRKKTSSKKSGK